MNILNAVITGVIATAMADLWQQLMKRCVSLPTANWKLAGRWVVGMTQGVFTHRSIDNAAPVPGEAAVGWTFHYLVGITYAFLYLACIRTWPEVGPGLVGALAFGIVTLVAPWFIVQPALGFGFMARCLPNQLAVMLVTINTHLMFGLGLYTGLRVAGLLISASVPWLIS